MKKNKEHAEIAGTGGKETLTMLTEPQKTMLTHQTLAARVYARAYLYQIGGAYGFRDQLQDCMNLVDVDPKLLRRQIYRCAAAQFPQGDALHWFHPIPAPTPHVRGVRTRCADDLLWLPLAAAALFRAGKRDFLQKRIRYLAGEPLAATERERCADFYPGETAASVYTHCLAAVKAAERLGPHGLPLFGSGDWNDAFSGLSTGESVWMGEFLALVCDRFLPVAAACGTGQDTAFLSSLSERMKRAVLTAGYNGTWFLRGYYPDGAPLGDGDGAACAIDLLPQAFAVFAGIGSSAQRRRALEAAFRRLYAPETQTLRLFTPPFGPSTPHAGYINEYPPGVRENGGQYTHAAVWFYLAALEEGLTDLASQILPCIVPWERARDPAYPGEPYFVAADVGDVPDCPGLLGWTGYTGAAGWLLRAAPAHPSAPGP